MSDVPRQSGGVAAVVIGRNEGERLVACLESLRGAAEPIVYVDSGSTDGSVARARERGADVVTLDTDRPFTAARARNAGAARVAELASDAAFLQFVDGDCTLAEGWIEAAVTAMSRAPRLAVACGRRRERAPDASVYNRLCDMEWDTPVGPAGACGGDSLVRRVAFDEVDGFDEGLIAGEEPELCVRLRSAGWTIERLDAEMTRHDARMERFGQWWRRARRAGHAYAEARSLHGAPPERSGVREVRSSVVWGAVLPLTTLGLAWPTRGMSVAVLGLLVAVQWRRIRRGRVRRGDAPRHAGLYATFCLLGKLPEALGMATYWLNRLRGRRSRLIEYKGAEPGDDAPAGATLQPCGQSRSQAKGGGP